MGIPDFSEDKRYTYSDYAGWELDEFERYELIDGVPYMMSAPSTNHQRILSRLNVSIGNFLLSKNCTRCEVFQSPVDVRLEYGESDRTVVQPDLIVLCDRSKDGGKSINGAPDLAVEVLSPSTARYDMFIKMNIYRLAGVKEYWIIDPEQKTLIQHILIDCNEYKTFWHADGAFVSPTIGCEINLDDIFDDTWE